MTPSFQEDRQSRPDDPGSSVAVGDRNNLVEYLG